MGNIKLRNHRNKRGSILVIGALALGLITAMLFVLTYQLQFFMRERTRLQSATEAAALTAASDISRIIVRDSDWGFVALSDQPPAGTATMAADREPLPVSGVNTMLASSRLEKLISDELKNPELDELSEQDVISSRAACNRLQNAMDIAITPSAVNRYSDMNGNKIDVFNDVRNQFAKNIPDISTGKCKVEKLKISLGWLEEGSTTCSLDPMREMGSKNKYYPAFVNVPVAKNDFYFAGVGEQPRLVDPSRFRLRDGKRFCSAILVETKLSFYSDDHKKLYDVESRAAALPYGGKNRSAAGSMAVFLPQGGLSKFRSIRALLDSGILKQTNVAVSRSHGGDYPAEPKAKLVTEEGVTPTLSSCVGRAMFDWIRTTRARMRLSSIIDMVNTPFDSSAETIGPGAVLLYDLDRKGTCQKKLYRDGGFLTQTVSEGQSYVITNRITETEKGMLGITIRNQVSRIGETGGQHGGQPMLGELPVDYSSPSLEPEPDQTGGTMRKSAVKGGLAVCIQLFAAP